MIADFEILVKDSFGPRPLRHRGARRVREPVRLPEAHPVAQMPGRTDEGLQLLLGCRHVLASVPAARPDGAGTGMRRTTR